NLAALNLGWYLDWHTALTPTRPNNAEYYQVVRIHTAIDGGFTFTPPTSTLQAAVLANPGAIWLIGNEPDSPAQDGLLPELYARAYHHLYGLIKSYDATAQIGAGGIVQPTPLRLQYLDRVLAAYRAYYSQTLPADLWNVHTYILREITDDDPESVTNGGPYEVWGAYVPPGSSATRGELYTYSQMFSQSIFRQRLIDFRSWMARNGYRNTPLIITEYGTLFPYPPYLDGDPYVDENNVPMTEARTATFMTGTFNTLQTLSDPGLGYRPDGERLVQRWAWYSTNDVQYGGILFYTMTQALNPLGQVFAAYTNQLTPTVDLFPLVDPFAVRWEGQPVTVTLRALIANQGNISASQAITVTFYDGPAGSGSPIGTVVLPATELRGCGGVRQVDRAWSLSAPGAHPFSVKVETAAGESTVSNNTATAFVLVSTQQVYLPTIVRAP
ncbi:MAG TPA: hypothetical protein VLG46_07475, partial [Anaerolineae bacterium]|nr:hypothetical protein [Anaerolineae bacterium]